MECLNGQMIHGPTTQDMTHIISLLYWNKQQTNMNLIHEYNLKGYFNLTNSYFKSYTLEKSNFVYSVSSIGTNHIMPVCKSYTTIP